MLRPVRRRRRPPTARPTRGWGVIALGRAGAPSPPERHSGRVNGVLVAVAKIPPLIVTLGTFGMALGFAH